MSRPEPAHRQPPHARLPHAARRHRMTCSPRFSPSVALTTILLMAGVLGLSACSATRSQAVTLEPTYSVLRDEPERAALYTIEADQLLAQPLTRRPNADDDAAAAPALP